MELTKGANTPVPENRVNVVLTWSGSVDVDVAALLCAPSGKVRSDDDFIFYNQPRHHSNAVAHLGKSRGPVSTDSLAIDLGSVENDIEKIVISGSADGGSFGQLSSLSLTVSSAASNAPLMRFHIPGATVETALVAGELYRRNGVWKFRAVGQGYSSGLRGVASDFGITVDDDELVQEAPTPNYPSPNYPAPPPPPGYPSPAYPPPNAAPGPQPYPQTAQYGQSSGYPEPQQTYTPPPSVPQYGQPTPTHQPPEYAQQGVDHGMDSDAPEDEVTLRPFDTDNPYLKRVFKMKEFGRAPGRALTVYRERVIDPDEKMIAAFKSKHGQYKWGYLVLTSHALRWFQTLPTRDEDLWSWDDVELVGSVVRCEGWQYQLKGFGAGRKFKALMLVLAQSEGWEKNNRPRR